MSKVAIRSNCVRQVLGLFAKEPLPGQVKTRLAIASSPTWAATVAQAFLLDVVDRLARIEIPRVLSYAPANALSYFEAVTKGQYVLCPQGEGDLGHRMALFFDQQMAAVGDRVVLVGTDSPTMPPNFIQKAFEDLARVDVVLGPATDGGYYLVGCSRPVPFVFENIRWSSSRVLADTMIRLIKRSVSFSVLPPWYDVDTLDDWWMLRGHLLALRQAGIDPEVPRTETLANEQSDSPTVQV